MPNNIGAIDWQFPHFTPGPVLDAKEAQEFDDRVNAHELNDAQRGESFSFCADVNDCQKVFNPDGSYSCARCNITG